MDELKSRFDSLEKENLMDQIRTSDRKYIIIIRYLYLNK
jgi:hypothetical protein